MSDRLPATRELSHWGQENKGKIKTLFLAFAIVRARELVHVGAGDILVVTAGQHQKAGGTDLIRVITLEN